MFYVFFCFKLYTKNALESRHIEVTPIIKNDTSRHAYASLLCLSLLSFTIFYNLHKILTLVFTGKLINFGNFSLITKKDAEIIIKDPTIIYCFASTLKNKITKLGNINCIRGTRYFGPSKMPLLKLIIHSFSIIAVFKMNVFIRSALFLVLLSYLQPYLGEMSTVLQLLIIVFNILIYLVSTKSNENKLKKMDIELGDIKTLAH